MLLLTSSNHTKGGELYHRIQSCSRYNKCPFSYSRPFPLSHHQVKL